MDATPTRTPRPYGLRWMLFAAVLTAVALGILVLVAALAADQTAIAGALVGGGAVLGVSLFGVIALSLIGFAPGTALLLAMTTYVLQVMVLALLFVSYQKYPELRRELDAGWLAGGIVTAVVGWVAGYLVAAFRDRELPAAAGPGPADQAGAR